MKLQIKILDTVLKRLHKINKPSFGNLYGIFSANTLIVLGLQKEIEKKLHQSYYFPAELDFCGIFEAHTENIDEKVIVDKAENIYEVITDNPLFIDIKLGAKNEVDTNIIHNSKIEKVSYTTTTDQEVYSQFTHLHLKGHLPLRSELSIDSLTETFQNLRHNVASGVIAFTVPNKNIFLLGKEGESSIVGLSSDPTIAELYEESNAATECAGNKKKKSSHFELEIVDVAMVRKISKDCPSEESKNKGHAPVVILDKKHLTVINTTIPINFLAIINRNLKFSKAYDVLLETVMKHLRLLESVLVEKIQTTQGDNCLSVPETFHFYPSGTGHFISKVYFKSDQEQDLRWQRELLHRQFILEMDAPKFRRANQYIFKNALKNNGPIINPHEGVRPTENGHIALVKGKYEYYHYCQDKMDDNGWGCAYRSLQTLSSWFILQGYTVADAHVPTFQEIQQCLVDIGDKPKNFIGSKQWIGSTEVNFVLESLFGITSKILYVSSGEEMGSKGPELVNHFETHGSPVMIGGGVLAHTILGVDYNQQAGTIKFLILDPHYTGSEDLHTIQSKCWCGWKTVDFWNKSAYYNMCLPQVPREI